MRARRGDGKLCQRLKNKIIAQAKTEFETDDVKDVTLFLPTGYYLKSEADCMPIEGCLFVDGQRRVFDSWEKVTDLVKCKKLEFTFESSWMFRIDGVSS